MAQKIQVAVIGLGKFGAQFAVRLAEMGHEVVGIDVDADKVKKVQQALTYVYRADAMDKEALVQVGVPDCTHALVSVGTSISASSMICMYLKELGLEHVWVKAIHADHQKLLEKIGADEVVIPEHSAARELASRMAVPGFVEYLHFGTDMAIKELTVDRWRDRTLRQLDLTNQHRIQIIARKRADSLAFNFIPEADAPLNAGDVLVAIGRAETLEEIKP